MLTAVLLSSFATGFAPGPATGPLAQEDPAWGPWWQLGPIENPEGANGVENALPPEKDLGRLRHGRLGPRLETDWAAKGGGAARWVEAAARSSPEDPTGDEAVIDLRGELGDARANGAAAYLYRLIEAPEDRSVPVLFASDDGFKVWLNGERLLAHDGARKLEPGEFSGTLPLRTGKNHLLVKVTNGASSWAFQMQRSPAALAKAEASLDAKVDAAIERGIEYLISTQFPDGSWDYHTYPYRNGQTALSLYALLKSGVSPRHPACVRAVHYLSARRPVRTYSAACQLMAFEALHDEEVFDEIEAIAELLLEWMDGGGFAYPQSHIDLSNTQYGALGLRAAASAGVKIRDRVWVDMAQHAQRYQNEDGGFGYLPGGQSTGSMTAAGLTVYGVAREMLGDRGVPGRLDAALERSTVEALNWLAERWDVSKNPSPNAGQRQRWHPYYLYGLERVGGLLRRDRIGPFDWYSDGAHRLILGQGKDGQWATAHGEPQPNTAFALLFLERATSVMSGDRTRERKPDSWGADDPTKPLSVRASGGSPLTVFVSSWGTATRDAHAWEAGADSDLRVRRVEYVVDGEVRETVEGDPTEPTGIARYPARIAGLEPGAHQVVARVTLAKPPPDSSDVVVESEPLQVTLQRAPDPTTFAYGRDAGENLLRDASFEASASSQRGNGNAAERAADGRMSTAWISADEPGPHSLTLSFDRALKADTLLLSPAHPNVKEPEQVARPKRVLVIPNGNEKRALTVDVEPDVHKKTTIDLGRRLTLRKLELRILETAPGKRWKHATGFAEVELLANGRGR